MATGAGLAEWEQTHGKKKAKYVLTSTGLLMEGVEARVCRAMVLSDMALRRSRGSPQKFSTIQTLHSVVGAGMATYFPLCEGIAQAA